MAGPKLNEDQKAALRTELKEQVDAGTRQVDICASLSQKYGVSGETIRYYLKHSEAPTPTNGKKVPRRRRAGRQRVAARTSDREFLREAIQQLSEDEHRRALKAKAVLVEYERLSERERDLSREYRMVRAKTRKLKRLVKRLTR